MKEGLVVKQDTVKGKIIVYRYPRWSDLEQYLPMHQEFHAEQIMASHQETDRPTACRKLGALLTEIEMDRTNALFVFVDDELVGEGSAVKQSDFYAVVGLALRKKARGLGIGKQLMLLLEDEARKLKRYKLYLDVWAANTPGYELYKKLGYVECARRPLFCKTAAGEHTDLISMIKDIKP